MLVAIVLSVMAISGAARTPRLRPSAQLPRRLAAWPVPQAMPPVAQRPPLPARSMTN